ncbi:MAG: DUF362 domain-containing protein [Anaerolineales bacterium]
MTKVSLVRCDDYEPSRVESALRRNIDLLGGMESFVSPGQRVLLKPNLVRAVEPERAVSTHPTVVAAVAKLVREVGAVPVIVESPGGPYNAATLRGTYRRTEMDWAAEIGGAELNYNVEATQVSHPEGNVLRRLDVVQPLLEADAVINLAKLKTHNLTGLTLAVKNLFGLVPGIVKIGYHAKLQERRLFCEGLVDIFAYVQPVLNIMDAVVGMEGQGPSGGDPRPLNALIAGADALAVDVVSAALVGYEPLEVLTTRVAAERGLTTGRMEDISLLGESLAALQVDDFRRGVEADIDPGLLPGFVRRLVGLDGSRPEGEGGGGLIHTLSHGWMWRQLVALPHAGEKCTGCGYCVDHCPVGAIEIVDGKAHMDPQTCIRCYCCHELCPQLAVELRRPLLGRLLLGN